MEPVARLEDYLKNLKGALHELPEEREDWVACQLLLEVALPNDCEHLKKFMLFCAEPRYRKNRTLEVWFGIARATARMIQEHQETQNAALV
jgi:hypothetical protein